MSKTEKLYSETVREALKEAESLARQAFKKDKRLIGCIIAMGSATFQNKRGDILDDSDADKYPVIKPFFDFMDEWDEYLKISGAGLWFKSDGTTLDRW